MTRSELFGNFFFAARSRSRGRSGAGRSAVGDDIRVELRSTGDGTADTARTVSRSRSLEDRVGWRDAPQPLSDQLGERLLQALAEVQRSNGAMAVRVAEMGRRGGPSSAHVILPSILSEREALPALPQLLPTAVVDDSAESAINMEVDSYLSSSEEEVRSWRPLHLAGAEDVGSAEEARSQPPKRNNADTFPSSRCFALKHQRP